ncbi:zinc finger protein 831 isoform X2 [Rhinoraja longicauda]
MEETSNMTAPSEDNKEDMNNERDSQESATQNFLLQSHKRVLSGLNDTPPTSTVIVQVAKSTEGLSPSQPSSPPTNCSLLSVQQGLLQNSSTSQQGSSKACHVSLADSTLGLQTSQSKRMGKAQLQNEKDPSLPHPCQTGSRLKPTNKTTGVQLPPCTPKLQPFPNSAGLHLTSPAAWPQSAPETISFQPTPSVPKLKPTLCTTGLELPLQISSYQPLSHTSELYPPPQTPRIHPGPKSLGLQASLHDPSLHSCLHPSRLQHLPLTPGLQTSFFTLRLQLPTQTSELQCPTYIPELQTSPCNPRFQSSPQTAGLPTTCIPGIQTPHQNPRLQMPLYRKELHIVQLPENVQQNKPNGQRKFVCNECGRDCAKRSALEKHIRSHTGERPFPCITCGISFKTQSNLYKHNRTQSHLHNCQLSTELVRSNRPELSQVKDKHPCENIDQEAKGNCHLDLLVANSSSVDHTKRQDFTNIVQRDSCWRTVHATDKREDGSLDGEKQANVQLQLDQMGNRHLVLQRQQATYFAKQWVHKSSNSSVQTNESTDSGYFSHSDSPDQPQQSLQHQSTDTESERCSQSSQQWSSVGQSVLESAVDDKTLRGMHHPPRGMQELEERISKLISDNKAVVDDKHLETVRPRKTLNSKQGSIDLPMPYTFKDSFHFDMKPVLVNKKSRVPSSLPAFTYQRTHKFPSLSDQVSSTVACLPIIRSNSAPVSKGCLISSETANSLSCHLQVLQRKSTTMSLVTDLQSHSLDFHPQHPRTLVRQTALEGLPAGGLTAEGSNPIVKNKTCNSKVEQVSKHKCRSLVKNNDQKKLKKFSHEKWLTYGEETFRKKYQEPKGATHSAELRAPHTKRPHSVKVPGKGTSALSENPHINPLASSSAQKVPIPKHLSDALPLASVKVTTFNTPMCQVQFSQQNVDQHSPQHEYPVPCHNAKETKAPLIPDRSWEVPAIKSAEKPNRGGGTGKITASHTAQATVGDMGKELTLHQRSSTASGQKCNDATRPMQTHLSHPKLVRQLSVLVPEGKQEGRSQEEHKPNEFSLRKGEDGILEIPSGIPPRKKQRLKIASTGQSAKTRHTGCGLPVGAVLCESPQSNCDFTPDTTHESYQVIKCMKWKEEESSVEQPLTPTVYSSFTAPGPSLYDCSRSLPEQEAALSTFPSLHLQSFSVRKSKKKEAISQGGFPTLLQTAGNHINNVGKNLQLGVSMDQWEALASPQAMAHPLLKQDFLPKYQLKWTKKEPTSPSRSPS